jgi:hypothetical protein
MIHLHATLLKSIQHCLLWVSNVKIIQIYVQILNPIQNLQPWQKTLRTLVFVQCLPLHPRWAGAYGTGRRCNWRVGGLSWPRSCCGLWHTTAASLSDWRLCCSPGLMSAPVQGNFKLITAKCLSLNSQADIKRIILPQFYGTESHFNKASFAGKSQKIGQILAWFLSQFWLKISQWNHHLTTIVTLVSVAV